MKIPCDNSGMIPTILLSICAASAVFQAPSAAAPASNTPPFGELSRLAPLIRTAGRNERIPPNILRDFGIETDQPADTRRIIVSTRDGRSRYMILLVPVADQDQPDMVLVHMTYNERNEPIAAMNYRIDSTGSLRTSSRRPAGGDLVAVPPAEAAKPLAALVTFWRDYEERRSRTTAENSNPGRP